jgi:polyhydroxyalkanoate synthesis regulator phasin
MSFDFIGRKFGQPPVHRQADRIRDFLDKSHPLYLWLVQSQSEELTAKLDELKRKLEALRIDVAQNTNSPPGIAA